MDNKQNDWVLLSLDNPNFTILNFSDNGISVNNTSIYDRDRYLNSSLIQSKLEFLTNGRFDPVKFNLFYDKAIASYNDLSTYDYAKVAMDAAEFSYNNLAAPLEKRTKLPGWDIVLISNPDRRKYGVERLGFISDPTFTPLELALNELIWNNATKLWEDSPNDAWLGRNWSEPVAMAIWEFDADANGNKVDNPDFAVYHKGEYKINPETGTYYYETLNGKSPYGRELLTPFDIITKDGSKANAYDFFDSDGLDKSFTGSLMKNVARIAPMFIPYVNSVYIASNIALELGKVLPIVYKSTFGLAGGDNSWANRIEGIAMSFDNNKVSKAGLENMFTSEQIFNMIADITKLLYEQRWVFTKAPRLFKQYGIELDGTLEKEIAKKAASYEGNISKEAIINYAAIGKSLLDVKAEAFAKASLWGAKYLEEYLNIGKIMSRLYMTGTSSYLAFSDAKEAGASDLEAAAMFWGYASGMYWLMSTEVGEHVLPELRMDKVQIRKNLELIARGSQTEATRVLNNTTKETLKNLFKRIFTNTANYVKSIAKIGTKPVTEGFNSVWSNMLAEGIEEVSEEVLYDVTRATFDVLAQLSGSSTRLSQWDTALERYGLSFFGGMLGGGLFQISNDINIRKAYRDDLEDANLQIIYYIRNGKEAEIKRLLEILHKRGSLANPNFSTLPVKVEDGNIVYGEATPDDDLNTAVYKLMTLYVDNIHRILSTENMLLPDDSIITDDNLSAREILLELRYRKLMLNELVNGEEGSRPVSAGKILLDYNSTATLFVQLHSELEALNEQFDSTKRNNPEYKELYDDIQRRIKELRKKRDEFFEPLNQERYLGIMMMSMDSNLAYPFANTSYRNFVKSNYHKELENLNDYEKLKSLEDYQEYLTYYANGDIERGYDYFIGMVNSLSKELEDLGTTGYEHYKEARLNFLSAPLEWTLPDGSTLITTIMNILPTLYGHYDTTDDEILEIAELLKLRVNPFDTISNLMVKPNLNLSNLSLQAKVNFINSLDRNLQALLLDRDYIDSDTATTIKNLVDQVLYLKLNDIVSESIENVKNTLLSMGLLNLHDVLDTAIKTFVQDINPDNLQHKLQEFESEIYSILPNLPDFLQKTLKNGIIETKNYVTAIFTPELANAYNNIKSKLTNVVVSPITSFLSKLKLNEKDQNVFDIINKALDIFSKKSINDFVVDGEITIEDVKQSRLLIEEIDSVVRSMMYENIGSAHPFGFTSMINTLRLKYGGLLLGVLTSENASLMLHDLTLVDFKLQFIEKLHENNLESSERELNRLLVKLNYLAYNFLNWETSPLWNNTGGRKLIDGEEIINGDIILAYNEAHTLRQMLLDQNGILDLKDDDRAKIEKERIAIEKAIYNRILELLQKFQNDPSKQLELIEILLDGVLTNDLQNATRQTDISINGQGITSKTEELSVNDKIAYLFTVIGIDPEEFLYEYKETCKEDNSQIAPIPMLEMAVKLLYSMHTNIGLYNLYLTVIDDHLRSNGESRFILKNTSFATGSPGAGKTRAVARMLHLMMKRKNNKLNIWIAGPDLGLANELKESIDLTSGVILDKAKLFEKLGKTVDETNSLDLIDYDPDNLSKGAVFKKGVYSNTQSPDVLFIDEATHFTALQLSMLSDWAVQNSVQIFIYGDPAQSGEFEAIPVPGSNPNLKYFLPNTIDATYCISSPKLTLSMRETNTNKRDNRLLLEALAQEHNFKEFIQSKIPADLLWKDLNGKLVLKGTEHSTGVYGEVNVDQLTETLLKTLLDSLLDKETIGYIYDNTSTATYLLIEKYKNDANYADKINMYDEKSALGREGQFFIVDLDWTNKTVSTTLTEEDKFIAYQGFVKSLNTTISRSKLGSYIIDNGLKLILGANSFKLIPFTSVAKVSMTDTSLKNYKENRIKAIEIILGNYTPPAKSTLATLLQAAQPVTQPAGTLQPATLPVTQPVTSSGNGQGTNVPKRTKNTVRININKLDQNNLNLNFNNNYYGLFVVSTKTKSGKDLSEIISINGHFNLPQNGLITEIPDTNYLLNYILSVKDGNSVIIFQVPKTEADLLGVTTVDSFIGNDDFVNNNYILGVIDVNNKLIFKKGDVVLYKGKLYQILDILGNNYTIANSWSVHNNDPSGRLTVTEDDMLLNVKRIATYQEFELELAGHRNSGRTIDNTKGLVNGLNNFAGLSYGSTVITEELNHVIQLGLGNNGGVGIKLYTAFGVRDGIAFDREEYTTQSGYKRINCGKVKTHGTSNNKYYIMYDYADDGSVINGNHITSDMAFLLNLDISKLNVGFVNGRQMPVKVYDKAKLALLQIRSKVSHNAYATTTALLNLIDDINNIIKLFRNNSDVKNWINLNNVIVSQTELLLSKDSIFKAKLYLLDIYRKYESLHHYSDAKNKNAWQNKILVIGDSKNEITLGTLPQLELTEKYVKSIRDQLEEAVKNGLMSLSDANTIIRNWENSVSVIEDIDIFCKDKGYGIKYIDLPGFILNNSLKITNVKLTKITKDGKLLTSTTPENNKLKQALEDLQANLSLKVSDPYIVTGVNDPHFITEMAGRSVVFVTSDLDLKYQQNANARMLNIGNNTNLLADLWVRAWNYQNEFLRLPDKQAYIDGLPNNSNEKFFHNYMMRVLEEIKPIKLDVNSHSTLDLIQQHIVVKLSRADGDGKYVVSLGNVNTGLRLLEILMNMETALLERIAGQNPSDVVIGAVTNEEGKLNFKTDEELIDFECKLRLILLRTLSSIKFYLKVADGIATFGNTIIEGQTLEEVIKEFSNSRLDTSSFTLKFGTNPGEINDTNTIQDLITNMSLGLSKVFDIDSSKLGNAGNDWEKGGLFLLIGSQYSFTIIDSLAKQFIHWDPNTGKYTYNSSLIGESTLRKISNLVGNYNNERSTLKNNFTQGIFFNTTYLKGQKGSSRTPDYPIYRAECSKGVYLVDVVPQTPDMIINGNAYLQIANAFIVNPAPNFNFKVNDVLKNKSNNKLYAVLSIELINGEYCYNLVSIENYYDKSTIEYSKAEIEYEKNSLLSISVKDTLEFYQKMNEDLSDDVREKVKLKLQPRRSGNKDVMLGIYRNDVTFILILLFNKGEISETQFKLNLRYYTNNQPKNVADNLEYVINTKYPLSKVKEIKFIPQTIPGKVGGICELKDGTIIHFKSLDNILNWDYSEEVPKPRPQDQIDEKCKNLLERMREFIDKNIDIYRQAPRSQENEEALNKLIAVRQTIWNNNNLLQKVSNQNIVEDLDYIVDILIKFDDENLYEDLMEQENNTTCCNSMYKKILELIQPI